MNTFAEAFEKTLGHLPAVEIGVKGVTLLDLYALAALIGMAEYFDSNNPDDGAQKVFRVAQSMMRRRADLDE